MKMITLGYLAYLIVKWLKYCYYKYYNMRKIQIIVVGGGGHAKQIIGTIKRLPQYEIIGFLDDDETIKNIWGIPNVGRISPVPPSLETNTLALGLGHVGKFNFRKKIIDDYVKAGYLFEKIVSPSAIIVPFDVEINDGAYIGDGAVLEPGVKIGKYAIINNCVCINHESTIGENTHIAPGVMVSGVVQIGNNVMVGTNSSIMQGIKIDDECIISMNSSVIKNLTKGEILSIFNKK